MAKKIILKNSERVKNSAVGFSYTTAYWGSIIPLIRLDGEGFFIMLGIEMCILLLGIMSFTQNNYLMYGVLIVLGIIIKIFLGFWYNKSYTKKLLKEGYEPANEYSNALLMLYGLKPFDDSVDIIKYKILIDNDERLKAILFIISHFINIISICAIAIFVFLGNSIFNFLDTKEEIKVPNEQTQEYSTNTESNTNLSLDSPSNVDYLYDEDINRADTVYDEVINKGNYDYLYQFSKEELGLIRNTFYARRGYIFTNEGYKKYFSNKSWYQPSTYSMDILPPKEKELVRIIKELEEAY